MTTLTPGPRSGTPRSTLELLYHISRELASDLDLRTVLRRVLLLSLESVEGNSGSIIVLDSKGVPVDSAIIHTGQVFDHTTQQLSSTLEKGLAGWVARNQEAVILPDTSLDERWSKRPDDAPDQTGPKSAMSAPLLARDELVGVITLVHPTPGTFTEEHGALMRAIADQAGIAIMNARLYEESQRKARVMTALAESSVAITASLGTEDILQKVLQQVQQALNVEAVSLALVDPGRGKLTIRAISGQLSAKALGTQIRMGEGIVGLVARTGDSIIVPNVSEDERFNPIFEWPSGFETRAIACAPIRTQGEIIGTLEAFNPIEGEFDPEAMLVLAGIGSLAGSVIRYARLFEQLEAAHQSYRELFDDSIDLILITDWEGRIQQRNRRAAEAFNLPAENMSGKKIFDLHKFVDSEFDGGFFSRLASRETVSYESQLSISTGIMPVQVYVRLIRLDNEDKLQWILHDITERKTMDALRDDLISMIYHDLRSPLANVIYSLDVMETMLPEDDETWSELIEVANRATDRIQRLTSSLLDIKTLESGQPIANRKMVSIPDLLGDALNAIRQIAATKGQQIELQLEEALDHIPIDQDMITRVLINLLENAVKYTPRQGGITVGARGTDDSIEIWVQDNGPGIPADQRVAVFNKYSRLTSGGMGFGLGLSFCRLAVEGHGGRIWVDSGEESGSRFVFCLPSNL